MRFLQGRGKRDGKAYITSYVEPLSKARTQQKAIFTSPENTKASIPQDRDEGFTHSVVPPWFGNGRLLLPFIALHSARHGGKTESATLGSRIRLGGEFRSQRAGSHHPPALSIPSEERTIPRHSH
jgi:hypothetical protein